MSRKGVKQTILDRVIGHFSPERGARRLYFRSALALAGGYTGARKDRKQTSNWRAGDGDADSVILPDLAALRDRSRDLERNAPLASGAIGTKVTSVVGTGIKPRPVIDRSVLNMTDDQADAWERAALREFALATGKKDFDLERGHNFYQSQDLVLRAVLSAGDILINLPRKARSGNPYKVRANFIEADRVCNPQGMSDSATLREGVIKDADGAPAGYYVALHHPGSTLSFQQRKWIRLDARPDAYGLPRVLHPYRKNRPGQSRGVPDLAPVVEMLKGISDYTNNELHASVVASLLTVFVKSISGTPNLNFAQGAGSLQTDSQINTDGLKLGSGSVVGLLPGEDIEIVDSKRPNTAAEAFLNAMAEQVGVALELPKEVLVKHFTSSYSAARAALLEAWRYFMRTRNWLIDEYCQPIWEVVIAEAVATGRLQAPGFFADPLLRQAYLRCKWTGDAPGHIDEVKAVTAAKARMESRLTTLEEETASMTGGNWEENQVQIAKENKIVAPGQGPEDNEE